MATTTGTGEAPPAYEPLLAPHVKAPTANFKRNFVLVFSDPALADRLESVLALRTLDVRTLPDNTLVADCRFTDKTGLFGIRRTLLAAGVVGDVAVYQPEPTLREFLSKFPSADKEANELARFLFPEDSGFAGKSVRVKKGSPSIMCLYDLFDAMGYINAAQVYTELTAGHPELASSVVPTEWAGSERPIPGCDVTTLVKIIMCLRGPKAAAFRDRAAELLVRYMGGDEALVAEIRANRRIQEALPEAHPARMFGEAVENAEVPVNQNLGIMQAMQAFFATTLQPIIDKAMAEKDKAVAEKDKAVEKALDKQAAQYEKQLELYHETMREKSLMLVQANQTIAQANQTIAERGRVNQALIEQFDADPNTLNSRVLPTNPDESTLDGFPLLRARLINLPIGIVAALFEGSTTGPVELVQHFTDGVLNVDVLTTEARRTVNTITARGAIQNAIKLRAEGWGRPVRYCTEITARQAYTIISNTEKWVADNMPHLLATHGYGNLCAMLERQFPGIKPLSVEGITLEVVPRPKRPRAAGRVTKRRVRARTTKSRMVDVTDLVDMLGNEVTV